MTGGILFLVAYTMGALNVLLVQYLTRRWYT